MSRVSPPTVESLEWWDDSKIHFKSFESIWGGRAIVGTGEVWADVYFLRRTRSGWASRNIKYIAKKFKSLAHAKEEYAIGECKADRHGWMLEFLILIMYLKNHTQKTIIVANTIFGAMEQRTVNTAKVIANVVSKLVEHVSKGKRNALRPYLFHLYH